MISKLSRNKIEDEIQILMCDMDDWNTEIEETGDDPPEEYYHLMGRIDALRWVLAMADNV